MTTFSNKFKNTIFGAFSPYFWEKNVFSKNLPLVHSTTWASVSENNNETIPRKLPDRQTDKWREGWKDRQRDHNSLDHFLESGDQKDQSIIGILSRD